MSTALEQGDAILRTARKTYRCRAADEVVGWTVVARYHNGYGECVTTTHAQDEVSAHEIAADRLDAPAAVNHETGEVVARYTSAEAVPRLNPNYRERADDCAGDINPGDRYVEYIGGSVPYQAGPRFCLPCGMKAFGS